MSSSDTPLRPLSSSAPRSLPDAIYDALLDMLISGQMAPHEPLGIDRISEQLQVSPTPVREALARLEHTGLVERQARRGYRVARPMSESNMRELVDARLVLETGALERAMTHLPDLIPDLEHALEEHAAIGKRLMDSDGALDPVDLREYFKRDWDFHQSILDHCGNRYIERSVNSLSFSVHRMRQTLGVGKTDAPEAVAEHKEILEAVKTGDVEKALDALQKHLSNVNARSSSGD
ncbi:GntR family transcriptional regulator [Actinomycetaceae bacterium MB13-C1-2]|nr:GntR family transcriptional regulator [Actinomycetaceae bacterium MB13-C1-2]